MEKFEVHVVSFIVKMSQVAKVVFFNSKLYRKGKVGNAGGATPLSR